MPAMRPKLLLGVVAAALLIAAPAGAATPFAGVQAHRGGPLVNGKPTHHENSLEGYIAAHKLGADVIEFDVKLTADNVPVIMHDQTLDRTTNCTGPIHAKTLAELDGCGIDILGWDNVFVPAPTTVPIPKLSDVLAWAKANKVKVSLEIKNIPTDQDDYDPTPAFATTVLDAIEASGIPKSLVLVQSFWPPNLDLAKQRGFKTSYLILAQGATIANLKLSQGYSVVSPGWPLAEKDAKKYVAAAHKMGQAVIPYTLDTKKVMQDAIHAGVDAFITNDPTIGLKTLYGPACDSSQAAEKKAAKKVKSARTATAKAKARRALVKATKKRKAACARAGE
jgi:glycerophosphoryl diester phosphodiesterase